MGRVRMAIDELMARREAREGRPVTLDEVARDAGVALDTLEGLVSNQVSHVAFATLAKLCAYFGCSTGDLMVYEQEPVALEGDEVESRDIVARWEQTYGADEHPPDR